MKGDEGKVRKRSLHERVSFLSGRLKVHSLRRGAPGEGREVAGRKGRQGIFHLSVKPGKGQRSLTERLRSRVILDQVVGSPRGSSGTDCRRGVALVSWGGGKQGGEGGGRKNGPSVHRWGIGA